MRILLLLAALAGAAMAAPMACAQEDGADQQSGAYRGYADIFAAFAKDQAHYPLLRMRLVTRPVRTDVTFDGLTLSVQGASTARSWPVDALAGAPLPHLQAAYDEDAVLRLNRPRGSFTLGTQVAIAPRADGVYSADTLRTACDQLLAYARTMSAARRFHLRDKVCAGVVFRYWKEPGAGVDVGGRPLPAADATLLPGCAACRFDNYVYRFDAWPRELPVVTRGHPQVIDLVYD